MSAYRFDMLRHWPLIAAGVSAVMLAIAHGFETFGGLAPCELCLHQREVYWVAIVVALVGFVAARLLRRRWAPPLACWVLAAVFLIGAGLAAYHAGVEWRWWPGPSRCTGSAFKISGALDLNAPVVMCDHAAWRLFGLSLAGYNAIISLGAALIGFVLIYRSRRVV